MRLTGRKGWGGVRFAVVVALVSLGFGGIAFSREKAGPDIGADVKGNLPGGQTSKSTAMAVARVTAGPVGLARRVGANPIETVVLQPIDRDMLKARDAVAKSDGMPLQFAEPLPVGLKVLDNAEWVSLPEGMALWRVRIVAPGALGLNFGMTNVFLPPGAKLFIYNEESGDVQGPFTSAHNKSHRELWTPIVPGESAVIEVTIPEERKGELSLDIAVANCSYLDFYDLLQEKQGNCNIDVICSQGDPWRNEIRSVGVYTLNGSWTCTGSLVMNQRQDFKNYFLTAYHCGVTAANAASVVVYWNFESPSCGQLGGGSLAHNQAGATFRARYSNSDFCLIELDQNPDPALDVHYAGWEKGGVAAPQSVGIHHPNCDEKALCFDNTALQSTTYGGYTADAGANHWRVVSWNLGVTEPGSSGSGLWNGSTHRLVGQLHGGFSSCSDPTASDWYGKLSASWTGGGTAATRLSDWLDPDATGLTGMDGQDPMFDDNYEENDSLAAAFDFTTEATWLSSVVGQGIMWDDDWYEISVSPAGYERVIVDCRFKDADGDIDIRLVNASGNVVASSAGVSDSEHIDHIVPGPGTYYIQVHGFGGAQGNAYDLWWDDLSVSTPAKPDLIVRSISHSPVDPVPGQTVTFTVRMKNQGTVAVPATFFNTGFWSSRASAPDISTPPELDQDYAAGLAAGATVDLTFNATAPAPGTHTAWAYVDRYDGTGEIDEDSESNNAGPMPSGYSWTVAMPPDDNYEENDTFGAAYDLGSWEQTWLSSIAGPGIQKDEDWYKIEVTPGYERVIVDCRFTHADGDIDIGLFDAAGNLLDSSVGVVDNEYIDYVVSGPGTYYVLVTYGDAGNAYDLWWDDLQESTPYHGIAAVVPGRVEMENFDEGGNGVAYLDIFGSVNGGVYRPGQLVDLGTDPKAKNGLYVRDAAAGEWLNYTINATKTGVYKIQPRVKATVQGGVFHIELDGVDVTGPRVVPRATGWKNLTISGIAISAGQHKIRVVMDQNSPAGTVALFDCMAFTAKK